MTNQEEKPDAEDVIGTIRPLLSQHFKPALLARMTIVPFYIISPDVMGEIVKMKLRSLSKRMQDSHKMTMEYTPAVLEHIVKGCTEVETGARNIEHIIRKNLLPRISVEILTKMSEGPLPDKLNLDVDKKGEYLLKF
jgi:type VI secretion system protein VasG